MFRLLFGYVIVLMAGFCFVSNAHADILILQSGQRITGEVIERTELRVTVEVQGVPQTYFLGEVASINGVKVEPLQAKNAGTSPSKIKKPNVKPNKYRANAGRMSNSPFWTQSTALQEQIKVDAVVISMYDMMGKMASTNRNVVATPDGGLIIVSAERIVKYDRNLNVVKEVDLKPDHPAGPK